VKFNDCFDLSAGFAVNFFDIVPKATIPGGAEYNEDIVAQGGFFQYYTVLGDSASLVQVPRATNLVYQNYGYFIQGRWTYGDALSLVAGARIDHNTRYSAIPVSPRAAIIYHNRKRNLSLKYIYSQAFVGPAPYFGYNVYDNGAALNVSNPGLEPETGSSHEINVTTVRDNLMLSGSVYSNTQQNLFQLGDMGLPVNIVQNEVYLDLAGTETRTLTHSANGGESKAIGTDLWARYKSQNLSYWTSYSYVYFESLVNEQYSGLPMLSSHNARMGLSWEVFDNFIVTPSVVYRSTPRDLISVGGLAGAITDPYQFNMFLLYTPRENLDLFAEFRNLTDHRYALKGILAPTPQDGFRATAGVRYSF